MLKMTREVKTKPGVVHATAGDVEIDSNLDMGLSLMGRALVAHLAKADEDDFYEASHSELVAELDRISDINTGVMWLDTLLHQQSGEVIVMHGFRPVGYRVKYHNLSSCFHFFTLLQAELAGKMPGSRTPNATAVAAARGEDDGHVVDEAWWHYGQGNIPTPDLQGMVQGEGTLDTISRIDGKHVMLVWPPEMAGRSWGAGFFRPIVESRPPSVDVVRELKDNEIDLWRRRLRLPIAKRKAWWKFW